MDVYAVVCSYLLLIKRALECNLIFYDLLFSITDHLYIIPIFQGDTFFIINSGQVRVTQQIENEPEPREIRILKQGDFFGEKALLSEEVFVFLLNIF